MSNPPYRALRIILGIVSVFAAAAGLLLVFSPLHPGHNTLAVALHAGHSPTLSRLPDLGSVANPVGTGRRALFPATAKNAWGTILEE